MPTRFEPPARPPMWLAGVGIGLLAASAVVATLRAIPASYARIPDTGSASVRGPGTSGPENVLAGDPDVRAATPAAVARRRTRGRCEGCGVIESVRRFGADGDGGLPDSIDAKVAAVGSRGAAGRAVPAPVAIAAGYEITVRLRDGSATVFTEATPRDWRVGNRVVVIGGAPAAEH
jgi:hypothetical protein